MTENRSAFRNRMIRPLAVVLLAATTLTALQGCAGLLVGSAVVGGALAASDRRTLGEQTDDKTILFRAQSMANRMAGDADNVNVTTYNQKILLTGEVRDEEMKAAVEREVARIDGVEGVVNEIAVMPPSTVASRSNDMLITGKVKASFVDARDIFANAIKVSTERGVVYLMGIVTEREGARSADVASRVGGVQKVVKVFDYISEEELQRIASKKDDPNRR